MFSAASASAMIKLLQFSMGLPAASVDCLQVDRIVCMCSTFWFCGLIVSLQLQCLLIGASMVVTPKGLLRFAPICVASRWLGLGHFVFCSPDGSRSLCLLACKASSSTRGCEHGDAAEHLPGWWVPVGQSGSQGCHLPRDSGGARGACRLVFAGLLRV